MKVILIPVIETSSNEMQPNQPGGAGVESGLVTGRLWSDGIDGPVRLSACECEQQRSEGGRGREKEVRMA